jgi:hypothetical protein
VVGLVAGHYGPELGVLFLAFPAIAPATATLLDQHVKKERESAGFEGHTRGRKTGAVDMFGTVWGCVGLFAFALVIWLMGLAHGAWLVYRWQRLRVRRCAVDVEAATASQTMEVGAPRSFVESSFGSRTQVRSRRNRPRAP